MARVGDGCVERRIDGIVHLDIQIHLVAWEVQEAENSMLERELCCGLGHEWKRLHEK